MKFSALRLPKFYASSTLINIDVEVSKSVSHFNWFARYDVSNETDNPQDISKITSVSGLGVNLLAPKG